MAYVLDENLRIAYCNPAWDRFAIENGGVHVMTSESVGRPVVDGISGPPKGFYEKVYKSALQNGLPVSHIYECSTAKLYRRYRMQLFKIHALEALVATHFLELECPHMSNREAKAADPHLYLSSANLLTMCSNCRRVRQNVKSDRWDWVPEYVQNANRNISHGLCPLCIHNYL